MSTKYSLKINIQSCFLLPKIIFSVIQNVTLDGIYAIKCHHRWYMPSDGCESSHTHTHTCDFAENINKSMKNEIYQHRQCRQVNKITLIHLKSL